MQKCEVIHSELRQLAREIKENYLDDDGFSDETLSDRLFLALSGEAFRFNKLFNDLYERSITEGYYWQFCCFNTYLNYYENRLKEYLNLYPDADEKDFIESEFYFFVKRPNHLNYFFFINYEYGNRNLSIELDFLGEKNKRRIKYSQEKKIKYLESLSGGSKDNIVNLNNCIEHEQNAKHENINTTENKFPEIFAENGFQTFRMLNEKYQKDNRKLRAKFSNLFWFLESEGLLKCTQIEYIGFIKKQFEVELSKILPKTAKYEDIIQPLLKRYYKGQQ